MRVVNWVFIVRNKRGRRRGAVHLECVSNSDVGVRFGIVNEIDKLVTIIITYIH